MTATQLQEITGVLVVFVVAVIPAIQGLTLTYIHVKQMQQMQTQKDMQDKIAAMHKQMEDNVTATINNGIKSSLDVIQRSVDMNTASITNKTVADMALANIAASKEAAQQLVTQRDEAKKLIDTAAESARRVLETAQQLQQKNMMSGRGRSSG